MTPPAVSLADVDDLYAVVGDIVSRNEWTGDPLEREELVQEGVVIALVMHDEWSGEGRFVGYLRAYLPRRLADVRQRGRRRSGDGATVDFESAEAAAGARTVGRRRRPMDAALHVEDAIYAAPRDIARRLYYSRIDAGVDEETAARQARVGNLAAFGHGPSVIAGVVGVSCRTVKRDLQAVRAVGTVPLMVASAIPTSVRRAT